MPLGIRQRAEFDLNQGQIHKQQEFAVCTNNCAEKVHRVGNWLTKPLRRQMNHATRIFGPHKFPDSTCKRAWQLIELFTLVIPIVATVLAVVGIALKFLVALKKPCASLIEASDVEFKILETNQPLHIMTYNMCLMPTFICNLQKPDPVSEPKKRALKIAGLFDNPDFNPDIVCLQEGFHIESTKILCNELKQVYPNVLHSIAPNEKFLNSGLIVASKYKITKVSYRPFLNCVKEDKLATKGFVRIELDLGEGRSAIVYNAHLQAKEGERYQAIRKPQLRMIRDAIANDDNGDLPIILCGDLNSLMGEFEETLEKEAAVSNRVDHILVYNAEPGEPRIDSRVNLSDHKPVNLMVNIPNVPVAG